MPLQKETRLNLKNFATKLTVSERNAKVFLRTKLNQLKYSKPNQWWKSVKSLCGMDPVSPSKLASALANSINHASIFGTHGVVSAPDF